MEYYSAIKYGWSTDTQYNIDEPPNRYAKSKKPDTLCHILYDPIYIDIQIRQIHIYPDLWLPETTRKGNGEKVFNG